MTLPSDPESEVTEVVIVTCHVMKTGAGTFSVKAYNVMGEEIAHAPVVEGAVTWTEALMTFWGGIQRLTELNRDFGEQNPN